MTFRVAVTGGTSFIGCHVVRRLAEEGHEVTVLMPELPEIARRAARGEPITVTRNAGLQFIWAGDLATVYSSVLGSAVNRSVFTALSPDFITWESIARWAVEVCGSASEIVVSEAGLPPAATTYDVSAIERAFGLTFDASAHLREHLAYLAGRSS